MILVYAALRGALEWERRLRALSNWHAPPRQPANEDHAHTHTQMRFLCDRRCWINVDRKSYAKYFGNSQDVEFLCPPRDRACSPILCEVLQLLANPADRSLHSYEPVSVGLSPRGLRLPFEAISVHLGHHLALLETKDYSLFSLCRRDTYWSNTAFNLGSRPSFQQEDDPSAVVVTEVIFCREWPTRWSNELLQLEHLALISSAKQFLDFYFISNLRGVHIPPNHVS